MGREGRIPTINGKVVKVERAKGEEAWNRTYQQPRYPYYYGNRNPAQPGQFLVIETNTGQAYIDTSMIAYLSTTDKGKTVKRRMPVLLFDVEALAPGPMKVSVMYLSKGMSWAPSYKVDTTDKKELTIEQKTVIKNELEDVEQAELQLITGYPSVKFGHVASPLSPRTNWASFFSQLNQRIQRGHASVRNVMSQQAVAYNRPAAAAGLDLSATPSGEGVDLHYQTVGKRTLLEGDSLSLSVASASAEYKRIVEWAVPDTRKASGQYIQEYERNQNPQKYEDVARDAVQFRNPFKFPMTTGAAMFVSEGRFTGQSLSYFVNSGEKTTLHITRALSIRTRHVEQEEKGGRETVYIGGKRFRKTKVQGELTTSNHRKEIVPLVIRRRFSGDLISADNSPRNTLMEEGVYSVNRRHELLWTLDLQPGESKTLKYRYSVLVHF
ncbi:MAG: hypothetical protein QF437_02220 [Planctomycetota bacterium]|nr:hypothetical protein [Planctomycetota bacterium]